MRRFQRRDGLFRAQYIPTKCGAVLLLFQRALLYHVLVAHQRQLLRQVNGQDPTIEEMEPQGERI